MEKYEELELDIIIFDSKDIITDSSDIVLPDI